MCVYVCVLCMSVRVMYVYVCMCIHPVFIFPYVPFFFPFLFSFFFFLLPFFLSFFAFIPSDRVALHKHPRESAKCDRKIDFSLKLRHRGAEVWGWVSSTLDGGRCWVVSWRECRGQRRARILLGLLERISSSSRADDSSFIPSPPFLNVPSPFDSLAFSRIFVRFTPPASLCFLFSSVLLGGGRSVTVGRSLDFSKNYTAKRRRRTVPRGFTTDSERRHRSSLRGRNSDSRSRWLLLG